MNTNWFECLTHLSSLKLGNTGKYDQPTGRKLLMTLSFFLINIALLWNFSWRKITQRCYTYLKNKKYPVFKFLCIFSQFFHGIFFKKSLIHAIKLVFYHAVMKFSLENQVFCGLRQYSDFYWSFIILGFVSLNVFIGLKKFFLSVDFFNLFFATLWECVILTWVFKFLRFHLLFGYFHLAFDIIPLTSLFSKM